MSMPIPRAGGYSSIQDNQIGEAWMSIKTRLLTCMLALGVVPIAMTDTAAAAAPERAPAALDQGALTQISAATPISVTVALRLSDLDAAETLLASLNAPGDPQYHRFLTAEQFVARFAPSKSEVAKTIASLSRYGLT